VKAGNININSDRVHRSTAWPQKKFPPKRQAKKQSEELSPEERKRAQARERQRRWRGNNPHTASAKDIKNASRQKARRLQQAATKG
jgi:hypothetical protein